MVQQWNKRKCPMREVLRRTNWQYLVSGWENKFKKELRFFFFFKSYISFEGIRLLAFQTYWVWCIRIFRWKHPGAGGNAGTVFWSRMKIITIWIQMRSHSLHEDATSVGRWLETRSTVPMGASQEQRERGQKGGQWKTEITPAMENRDYRGSRKEGTGFQ